MMAHSMVADLSAMADRSAGRLCRRHSTHLLEQEDILQDLLVDLLVRLGSYDPQRGPWRQFVLMCFRHRSGRLLHAVQREHLARHSVALDAPAPEQSSVALVDTLTEVDGYGAWIGQRIDVFAQLEMRLDLGRVLTTMPDGVVLLCRMLMLQEPDRGQALGLSRATVHRRVRDLHYQLLAAGIGPGRETNRRMHGKLEMVEHLHQGAPCRPALTEAALCTWVGQAYPGEQLVYCNGFLAIDAGPDSSVLTPCARTQLRRLADRAYQLFEQGRVHLVQRRHNAGEYSHIIIVRTRPKPRVGSDALKEILDRAGLSATAQPMLRSA